MIIALSIIMPLTIGTLLLAAGIVGRTVQHRRSFCRTCHYEITHRTTICSECGSRITASSLDIAFAINHPSLARLTAKVSLGKHKATRPLLMSGMMLIILSAALISATLYSGAQTHSWRALAPSSFLITTIEHAPSLSAATPAITELQRRADAGSLSPRLHARMEQRVNTLIATPAIPNSVTTPERKYTPMRSAFQKSDFVMDPPIPTNRDRTNNAKPIFAPPKANPSLRIVEVWPVHAKPRSNTPANEYTNPPSARHHYVRASQDLIDNMQANLRTRGLPSPDVLREHDFEIRVPSFQPVGTIAPLYPGLTAPKSIIRRMNKASRSQGTTTPFSHAPRRIKPKKL